MSSELKLPDDEIDSEWRKIQRDDDSWEPLPHRKLARWVEEKTRAALEARDAEIAALREDAFRQAAEIAQQHLDTDASGIEEGWTAEMGWDWACQKIRDAILAAMPTAQARTPQHPRFPWSEPQKIARQIRGDGGKERKG